MRGRWRGFVVKENGPTKFPMGEIDATFSNKTATFTSYDGTSHEYGVSTTMGDTFNLHEKDGDKTYGVTNTLVENLRYTTAMGLSTFENATYPDSFALGMKSNHTMNMVLFQCNKWGANSTCDFHPKHLEEITELKKKIGILRDGECGRCDSGTHTCHTCACGTDPDCKPKDQCEKSCA